MRFSRVQDKLSYYLSRVYSGLIRRESASFEESTIRGTSGSITQSSLPLVTELRYVLEVGSTQSLPMRQAAGSRLPSNRQSCIPGA